MEPSDFTLTNAWEQGSDALQRDIVAFWTANNALPQDARPEDRAKQVLFVARNADGRIAGVCSVYNAEFQPIGHRMYHFRTFIAPEARRTHMAKDFLLRAKTYLHEYNARLPEDQRALGVALEIEAAALQNGSETVRRACWSDTQMVFIGRTPRGTHLRLWYFPDALLKG